MLKIQRKYKQYNSTNSYKQSLALGPAKSICISIIICNFDLLQMIIILERLIECK